MCTGNICRSPMGEIVLRSRLIERGLTGIQVGSAGISDEEAGRSVDTRAQRVLAEAGYSTHARNLAHKVRIDELQDADLVLAMTTGHARQLRPRMDKAEADLARLHLWREFDGSTPFNPDGVFGTGGVLAEGGTAHVQRGGYSDYYSSDHDLDVPDPWFGGQSGFYDTLRVVESGADGIIAALPKIFGGSQQV